MAGRDEEVKLSTAEELDEFEDSLLNFDGDEEFEASLIKILDERCSISSDSLNKWHVAKCKYAQEQVNRDGIMPSSSGKPLAKKCDLNTEFDFDGDDEFETSLIETLEACESGSSTRKTFNRLYEDSIKPALFERQVVTVTDLVNQSWCERQLSYTIVLPHLKDLGTELQVEREKVMMRGTDIHLARELEIHDIIPIQCNTLEERWAVKLINCIQGFIELRGRRTVRELPVFGKIEKLDLFVCGIIDEVHWEDDKLVIGELKTRATKTKCFPSKAQEKKNAYQVAIYKELFDQMILGKPFVWNLEAMVGVKVNDLIDLNPLQLLLKHLTSAEYITVKRLSTSLLTTISAIQLPRIDSAVIEYYFSEIPTSNKLYTRVDFDDIDIDNLLEKSSTFWSGNRKPDGVEIEEAWKCGLCDYSEICDWREEKAKEYQLKNKRSNR